MIMACGGECLVLLHHVHDEESCMNSLVEITILLKIALK